MATFWRAYKVIHLLLLFLLLVVPEFGIIYTRILNRFILRNTHTGTETQTKNEWKREKAAVSSTFYMKKAYISYVLHFCLKFYMYKCVLCVCMVDGRDSVIRCCLILFKCMRESRSLSLFKPVACCCCSRSKLFLSAWLGIYEQYIQYDDYYDTQKLKLNISSSSFYSSFLPFLKMCSFFSSILKNRTFKWIAHEK